MKKKIEIHSPGNFLTLFSRFLEGTPIRTTRKVLAQVGPFSYIKNYYKVNLQKPSKKAKISNGDPFEFQFSFLANRSSETKEERLCARRS